MKLKEFLPGLVSFQLKPQSVSHSFVYHNFEINVKSSKNKHHITKFRANGHEEPWA